jgi:hypothetical protein
VNFVAVVKYSSITVFCLSVLLGCVSHTNTPVTITLSQTRQVAVTIDDLPVVRGKDLETRRMITGALINALQVYQIPAIGFVNEQKLGEPLPLPDEVGECEWCHPPSESCSLSTGNDKLSPV